jgi:hypothetical protein
MLVTSFYEIYGRPERISQYFEWFKELGNSGLPIIVFTDPEYVKLFVDFPTTVRVIPQSLDTFELYQLGMNYKGALPNNANKEKDTKEFLSLMNTKIEFIKNAMNHWEGDTFIWIDFGILKIVKDKKIVLDTLKKINDMTFDKVIIPGCWANGIFSFSVDNVYWRFCGGFFIISRKDIQPFYDQSRHVLNDFCTMPQYKLTWEVNIWTIVEHSHQHNIQWYQAGHDDTIITNINTLISK